jgi:transcription elongation factor GreB
VSKAFTRESDDERAGELEPAQFRPLPGTKHYITREGAGRLRQQLDDLLEKRRGLGGNIPADANPEVRQLDLAIRRLQSILQSVTLAEPPSDLEKVGFGASVRIRDQDGVEEVYQIVGPDEADPGQGRISSSSPLAQALMNRSPGDKVRFQSPAGAQELVILSLHY